MRQEHGVNVESELLLFLKGYSLGFKKYFCVCVRARARPCVCMFAHVRARVRACLRARSYTGIHRYEEVRGMSDTLELKFQIVVDFQIYIQAVLCKNSNC